MKKVILLMYILLSATTMMTAKKRNIKLNPVWQCKQTRSKCNIPEISHDGNILYVESENYIPRISISLKDIESGDVVYEEVTCINGEMSFFTNIIDGMYEIEMTIGDKVYVGQFEIGDEYEREDSIGECL